MSSLEKLYVQGIRSFGPEKEDAGLIKFSSPLTLILGENGCGKTTLIEAIKFATCGELPAGLKSSNANFVHDPKLSGSMEVKGQVKLQLKDLNGKTLSVTRIVSASQKLRKTEFKRIDQAINRKADDNTWTTISGKCADIDQEMCQALGVSKAVLSNVLLCHQEDSNWPLDEDTKVKAHFDEIFGQTKYTKCLDQVKNLRKQYVQDEKLLNRDVESLSQTTKDVAQKRIDLESVQGRLFEYKNKLDAFEASLNPIKNRLKELAIKEDQIADLKTEQETQRTKLQGVRVTIAEYKKQIQHEFKGTIEQLKEAISNFEQEKGEKEEHLEEVERQEEELVEEMKKNQQFMNDEQFKIGQLLRDMEKNKEKLEKRNKSILALSEDLDITTTISQLSQSDEIQRVFYSVEQCMSELEDQIKKLKEEQKRKVSELQSEIDSMREEKAKIDQNIVNQKKQLDSNKKELQKVKEDIFEADQSADMLGELQNKLDRVKKEIEALNNNSSGQDIDVEINNADKAKEKLEDEMAMLEREIQSLQSLTSIQAQLDISKPAKAVKDAEIKKMKSRHEKALKHLLSDVPEQGIKFQLEACLDKLADEIKTKTEELKTKEKELAGKEAEQKHLNEKLKLAKQTLEADQFSISQACNGQDYDSYLSEMAQKLQDLQDQKGNLSSSEFMFRKYVQKLQERDPCCPLCNREFTAENEVTSIINELSIKVKEVPTKLRENKNNLNACQEKYNSLLQLKPKYEKLSVMKSTEIPTLEEEVRKSEKKILALKESIILLSNEIEGPQCDEAMAKGMQSDIVLLEQLISESRKLDREIQKLSAKMPAGTKRSLDDALQAQRELRTSLQNSRRTLESLKNKKMDINVKKNKLQEQKNAIQSQQLKISGNVQMRAQLAEKREELESLEITLQTEIEKNNENMAMYTRKLDQYLRQMKNLETSNLSAVDLKSSRLKEIEQRYRELRNEHQSILEYEMSGGAKKLETSQKNLASLQKEHDTLSLKKISLADQKDKLKTDLSSHTVRQRELDDNLKLREKLTEEKELKESVQKLNLQIGNLDFKTINEEKQKCNEAAQRLIKEKAEAEGSKRELERNIETIKKELDRPHYKNADKNYREKVIEVEVFRKVSNDLNIYYKALDWAMMSYHHKRIEHINSVIKELWRKIYCGNDIDTIEIKAEADQSASAEKRRQFKYRVVQVKNGTELDMRGRCSAGQKVLASLIIRIALAETFSSTCGVLALDEPTTNLDHQNIIKLSEALAEVVRTQCNRRNFQLIVITHDQSFLNILSKVGHLDHYYKLERTHKGKSKVTQILL
ncbi:DNA repair protein RAD50 [Cimex lectularius]|uniref:Zinc-hook domain-containing protein n=1 Tax=Cimex lectularius TaxID=79782 RepID=A0A8I6RVX7_CIMLE|nr:DNA repair protein RAD50 [Cimex lectularius]